MDFALTDEQEQLRTSLRSFLESYCTSSWIRETESKEQYPFDLYERLAQMGLFGVGVPQDQGGSDGGFAELSVILQELGRISGSVVQTYMPTAVFGIQALLAGGPELRRRLLPGVVSGDVRLAFALTEADAGSDAAAVRTQARRDGDEFVINGSKTFCTGGDIAHYLVLTARTGSVEEGHRGLTLFVVDTADPGISVGGIDKLGHHAVQSCEMGLNDVRVPANMVVGPVGGAWPALIDVLDAERIGTAAVSVGLAQRCVEMALDYGLERRQFGRPVAEFQAISHMLAEMETETAAARWLMLHAAWLKDTGQPCSKAASMAKAYATECGTRTATRGMQVLGGYGYTTDHEMERFYREAKLYEVAGGSTQIQRNIIAREMGIGSTA